MTREEARAQLLTWGRGHPDLSGIWTHSRADNTPRPEHTTFDPNMFVTPGIDPDAYAGEKGIRASWMAGVDAYYSELRRKYPPPPVPEVVHIPNDDYRAFMTRARG